MWVKIEHEAGIGYRGFWEHFLSISSQSNLSVPNIIRRIGFSGRDAGDKSPPTFAYLGQSPIKVHVSAGRLGGRVGAHLHRRRSSYLFGWESPP
jgi:hypothetical protein